MVNHMERDFDLLGITAVEDKIQIGVPETVGTLKFFKFWLIHFGRIVKTCQQLSAEFGPDGFSWQFKNPATWRLEAELMKSKSYESCKSYKSHVNICQYARINRYQQISTDINSKQFKHWPPFSHLWNPRRYRRCLQEELGCGCSLATGRI